MRANERAVFEQFVTLCRSFAGRDVTWESGADPPDVLCHVGTTRIGVELAEWVDEWQIALAKRDEQEDESYRAVLLKSRGHALRHLREVWMVPSRALDPPAVNGFEEEFFAFIHAIDTDWQHREEWDSQEGVDVEDFAGYPTVAKYLSGLECYAVQRPCPSTEWLNLCGNSVAAYDPQDAADALLAVFRKKCAKYGDLHAKHQLEELYLLLFYDQAWQYNTPYLAPDWSFGTVARILANAAASDHGVFDKIYLFDFVNRRIARIWSRPRTETI